MAEAVVRYFLENLGNLLSQEANLLLGVDGQVRRLQDKLDWMVAFLKVADVKRRKDDRVKLWVRQIREVTYRAEDVLDEFMVKISQHRHKTGHGFIGSLTRCITCTHKLPILHELANQIKEINATMEEIYANRLFNGIENIQGGESSVLMNSSLNEAPFLQRKEKRAPILEEYVVGNKDSIRKVKSKLVEGELRRVVVSIVGMGGLGKTTLANKVYESKAIKKSFDCFAWVYVSQEYQSKELLQGLLKCVAIPTNDQETDDNLRRKLRERLRGKKYLIVLDDVWNTQVWDDLKTSFPDEKNGSRVLLTTRNKDVALHADASRNLLELCFLNKVESWELFLSKIFPLGTGMVGAVGCSSELENLGKKIVAKCGGLPLAIVVLGGLLSRKDKTQIAWSKVNDSVNWHLSTNEAGSHSCFGILASSYDELPYNLKSCFLYMGLFPKDSEMHASKLFQYWIAEGFIQRRGEEHLEDIAEDYLEELVHRSMIQVVTRKFDGRVKTCRIHDLLRDLSITEANVDQFFHVYGNIDFTKPNKVRRLTICGGDFNKVDENLLSQNIETQHLRSLMCSSRIFYEQYWRCCGVKLLRVLELQHTKGMLILPQEIGELIHLKYLGIRETRLKGLPDSINRLVNIQTVDLRHTLIERMPSAIWCLQQLRHLYIDQVPDSLSVTLCSSFLKRPPLGIDNLKDLRTLEILVGDWIDSGGLSKLKTLKKLILKGSLVSYKKVVTGSIAKLHGLQSLELGSSEEIPTFIQFSNHTCLSKLYLDGKIEKLTNVTQFSFPPNLTKLTLLRSHIETDPMVVLENLSNLRFLHLDYYSYMGKKMVCSQGGFIRLEVLKLKGLVALEEWVIEQGALIKLTHLEIGRCRLKMLPGGLVHLTTLQNLELVYVSDELRARAEEDGEDWDKIKHVSGLYLY